MKDALKSLGLKQRRRKDGRLDLVGKQDDGKEYVAHVAASEVTPADIQKLAECDREQNTPRTFVSREIERQRVRGEADSPSLDEWVEAAMPVAEAGIGKVKLGSSSKYRAAYERINW